LRGSRTAAPPDLTAIVPARSAEVLVVGAGPAGAAAARLLSLWGHSVRLIAKPSVSALPLAESIPPSTRKLFDVIGVRDAVDAAGFVRSTGNTVWWGSDAGRLEHFPDGGLGWQITSDRLESVLRRAAVDAGVTIADQPATGGDAPAFTLDCTGRSGMLARARGLRRLEPGHRTVALVGLWRSDAPFEVPDATHTVIESYADGWAWSVPDADARRFVAVMVDPHSSQLARGLPARDVYLTEIRKTRRFQRMLSAAQLDGGPAGWDASMYSAERYVDADVLLVGDAGSFIDPLSSAGVKKALASAWLAAVAVHTSLARPAMRETALAFFDAREREVYAAFRSMTERHLADAAAGHSHPFWTDRADATGLTSEAHAGIADVAVAEAFERIKDADTFAVRRSDTVITERRPAVSGCEIVLEDRLVSARDEAQGVRYAHDVDLVTLIDLAPLHVDVPDLYDAYQRRAGPVALPQFLTALATLVARGWLRPR